MEKQEIICALKGSKKLIEKAMSFEGDVFGASRNDAEDILSLIDCLLSDSEEEENDLFNFIPALPKEVQDVLNKYSNEEPSNKVCEALLGELELLGYTFDYGLTYEPSSLREMVN